MGALRAVTELAATFNTADVLVICYHRIRSRERFADQMAALSESGYFVLSLPQFTEWLNGHPLPSRPAVLLTFDHCYAEQLESALPVLEQFQFPATFFPVSTGLGAESGHLAVLRRNELRDMEKSGYTIGCHSHSHLDLTSLSAAGLHREVHGSKQILEEILGHPVKAFCYPYGACNPQVAAAVQRAGFEVAFTVDLGGVRPGDDPYQLKRVPVLGEPSAEEFRKYLSGRLGVSGIILLYWKLRERLLDRRGW